MSEVPSASFSSFVFIASLFTSSLLLLFEDGVVGPVISVVVRGVSGSDCDGSADEGDVVGDGAVFDVVVGDGVPATTEFCVDEEGLLLFSVLLEVDGDGEPATTEFCVDEEGLLLVPVLLEVDGDGVSTTDDGWSSLDGDGEVGNDADDGLGDEQGSTHKHMALG